MKATTCGFLAAVVLGGATLGSVQAGPDERVTSNEIVVKTKHKYKVLNVAYLPAPVEYTGHYGLNIFPWEAVQYYPRYYRTGNPWSH